MTCFHCPKGQGQMCSGGCGLCEVCEGEKPLSASARILRDVRRSKKAKTAAGLALTQPLRKGK